MIQLSLLPGSGVQCVFSKMPREGVVCAVLTFDSFIQPLRQHQHHPCLMRALTRGLLNHEFMYTVQGQGLKVTSHSHQ